tara:strand:+ start:524 stop:1411 length:888 start_codon:yes stop_codon:yes gene_type:complete
MKFLNSIKAAAKYIVGVPADYVASWCSPGYKKLQEDNGELMEDNIATRQELSSTKGDLLQTKGDLLQTKSDLGTLKNLETTVLDNALKSISEAEKIASRRVIHAITKDPELLRIALEGIDIDKELLTANRDLEEENTRMFGENTILKKKHMGCLSEIVLQSNPRYNKVPIASLSPDGKAYSIDVSSILFNKRYSHLEPEILENLESNKSNIENGTRFSAEAEGNLTITYQPYQLDGKTVAILANVTPSPKEKSRTKKLFDRTIKEVEESFSGGLQIFSNAIGSGIRAEYSPTSTT